jgi:nitroimidazol reductase NimA-like FMN-containing flavoprotein (pyridoxamine 5'-phosphate oxidase superfamily)
MSRTPTISKQRAIPAAQSWDLLRSSHLARVAVLLDSRLEVFPVTYTADHGQLFFRAQEGAPLRALLGGAQAVFEADGRHGDLAWSVVVTGQARLRPQPPGPVDSAERRDRADLVHPRAREVALTAESVTGRLVAADDLSQWGWS